MMMTDGAENNRDGDREKPCCPTVDHLACDVFGRAERAGHCLAAGVDGEQINGALIVVR